MTKSVAFHFLQSNLENKILNSIQITLVKFSSNDVDTVRIVQKIKETAERGENKKNEKGPDTKKRDKNNKTLFDIAYERKANEKVLRLFDEKCPSGRMQMVIEKLKGSYKKNSVILRNFIEEFSLEITDCHGMNLLHYACKEGIVNLVMDLVELGADVNGAMTRHCSRYYLYKYQIVCCYIVRLYVQLDKKSRQE